MFLAPNSEQMLALAVGVQGLLGFVKIVVMLKSQKELIKLAFRFSLNVNLPLIQTDL